MRGIKLQNHIIAHNQPCFIIAEAGVNHNGSLELGKQLIDIAAEANADADSKAKETADKLNSADAMIFQTEKQLKEFGDKLSDDKKKPIEDALEELKKAYETKDIAVIDPALEKINEAWKSASEEMYKAQQSEQKGSSNPEQSTENPEGKESDNVEDVDFEEVKE